MTHRRLPLLKWLMVVIPPITVTVGQTPDLAGHSHRHDPATGTPELAGVVIVTSLVTLLALATSYILVEALFRVLRRLQPEAMSREYDILTMNAVIPERERLSRELHDGAAQLVGHLLLRPDTIRYLVVSDRPREAVLE